MRHIEMDLNVLQLDDVSILDRATLELESVHERVVVRRLLLAGAALEQIHLHLVERWATLQGIELDCGLVLEARENTPEALLEHITRGEVSIIIRWEEGMGKGGLVA